MTPWTGVHQALPWDFPGKNTGVGYHFLLQRIFPTQESNPCLLHWQEDSLPLSHWGSTAISMYLSIIILNINGLSSPIKRHRVAEWIQRQDPCTYYLQESRFRSQETRCLRSKDTQTESEGI